MQEVLVKYLKAFEKLKRGTTKYGPAPHKPILLLSVLQAIQNNQIENSRIYVTPELIYLFKFNWNSLVKTNHVSTFALPFFHLHKEKGLFWNLQPNLGFEAIVTSKESISSLSELNRMIKCAIISDDLFLLSKDKTSNQILQQFILEKYFPSNLKHYNQKANEGLDELSERILNEAPEVYKKEILSLIQNNDEDEIFLRGSLFKREIPKIYNNTCCISGMKIDATINVSMIDACHIVPFSISYDDTITNGIALCPNLHRAFDRGLIAIDENYKVIVSNNFREDGTNYSIGAFEGKEIQLPKMKSYYPLKENFGWHRENVFK
jgi:putative restriction endonuclease